MLDRGDLLTKFTYCENDGVLRYKKDSGRYGRYKSGTAAGFKSKAGVVMVGHNGRDYQAHQIIWLMYYGEWPKRAIRHLNGDRSDNRVANMKMDSMLRGRRNQPMTVERLREMIEYNPDTGVMKWLVSPRNRTLVGDSVGYYSDQGYLCFVLDQQRLRLHRAAWAIHYGEMPLSDIDHINGVRDDNRISNLRVVTRSQNGQNAFTRSDNTSGVKGVHFRKDTGKFSAQIQVDGKVIYLGCFGTLSEAESARIKAEKRMHTHRKIN